MAQACIISFTRGSLSWLFASSNAGLVSFSRIGNQPFDSPSDPLPMINALFLGLRLSNSSADSLVQLLRLPHPLVYRRQAILSTLKSFFLAFPCAVHPFMVSR